MRTLTLAFVIVLTIGCGSASHVDDNAADVADNSEISIAQFTTEVLIIEEIREGLVERWGLTDSAYDGLLFAGGAFGRPNDAFIEVGKPLPDDLPSKQEYVGVSYLAGDLALLEAPSVMQPIKDALLLVYQIELSAAADHGKCVSPFLEHNPFGIPEYSLRCNSAKTLYFDVNKDNVEQFIDGRTVSRGLSRFDQNRADSSWARAQKLRASTYERWYEILLENDLDPTLYPALIGSRTSG
jgi:hypothetical protein